jgi:hypothetical protein
MDYNTRIGLLNHKYIEWQEPSKVGFRVQFARFIRRIISFIHFGHRDIIRVP